ncbi:hypothetical protein K469DRAFT_755370 [Zopfia rhizophila CBS 207.26]|uniref:DUF7702 domain-containing protein n=1 Tax=Zopfia rhizophila CBS 207.26 TaxID=1314779 RepID=A0A6A6DBU5_9PEZI|nr:hypothetical protein K469DRAFT_755370 [Zopfia rhizophila CBS 207.26]
MLPHDRLAVAELVLYGGTALPAALWLWVREGWRRLEWLFVFTLATLRIIGSILQLKQPDNGPPSSVTSIAILNGIGLSPLLCIMLMLVHRLCKTADHQRLAKIAILLHALILGALPLLIVGVLKLFKAGDGKTIGRILAAIGLAIFLQVYLAQTLVAVYAYTTSSLLKKKPFSFLSIAVLAMAPLILLRLIYSALSFFVTSSKTFNPVTGSLTAQVIMSIVPENAVTLIAVAWGLLHTEQTPKNQYSNAYELSR